MSDNLRKSKYLTNESTKNMEIIIRTYESHHLKIYNKPSTIKTCEFIN